MLEPPHAALSDFGRMISILELLFDEHGYCCLLIDDVTLSLEYDPLTDDLLAYAHMGMLPETPTTGFYELLLEANFFCRDTGTATLGIDTASSAIVLFQRMPCNSLSGDKLEAVVTRFVNNGERWRKRIAKFNGMDGATSCFGQGTPADLVASRI